MNIKELVLRFRTASLCLLAVVLFVNWYLYIGNHYGLQEIFRNMIVGIWDSASHHELLTDKIPSGLSFLVLSAVNVLISMSILFVYFRANKTLLKIGFVLMTGYMAIGFVALAVLWALGMKEYFGTVRYAMDLISSPLVEATTIPLLRLYQRESS